MIRLRYLRRALDDLDDACAWTATHRPAGAAEALARLLLEAAEGLRAFPERGRPGRVPGTRELVIPRLPFILVYRLMGRELQVLAILHQSRAWPGRL